jgi:hypothetical protein
MLPTTHIAAWSNFVKTLELSVWGVIDHALFVFYPWGTLMAGLRRLNTQK